MENRPKIMPILWGGEKILPSPAWKKLVGLFGDSLCRTVLSNSNHPEITPATLTEAQGEALVAVIAKAKKEGVQ